MLQVVVLRHLQERALNIGAAHHGRPLAVGVGITIEGRVTHQVTMGRS